MEKTQKKEMTVVDVIRKMTLLARYLLSKWVIILAITLCFGILGVLYAWLQKPIYIAEMSFTTETESASKLGAYAGIAAQFGFDLGGSTNNMFEGDNLVDLLKSRNLVEKTLLSNSGNGKSLMIDEYLKNIEYKPKGNEGEINFSGDVSSNTRVEDSLLTVVYKDILGQELEVFKKDKKISVIIIKMKNRNEHFAKRFVELLALNTIHFYTDYKSKKSRQNVEILQRQTDSVRSILFGSINDVAVINDLNVNPLRQAMRIPAQRRQVDVQVNSTLYGELLKNLELSKLALRKETPLIQIIDTPRFPLEKKKLGRFKGGIVFAFIGGSLAIFSLLVRRMIFG